MSEQFWLPLTILTGEIGFTLSIVSNTVLFFLIHFRSHHLISSFKFLLLFFCLFTAFYSSVELLLRPLIHIYDDTLFLIQRKRYDWGKTVTRLVPSVYCGCYAMSFTLFAIQFIHRYISTCRTSYLKYFDVPYFFIWIICGILIAISWGAAAYFLYPQNERTQQSFEYIMNHSYGLGIDHADYVPYKYFYYDQNEVRKADLRNILGVVQHLFVVASSYSILFYCGIRTYLKLRSFKGISDKTRDLQYQLFRALVVQTTVPMILMYFPAGFMFACPLLGFNIGATINLQTIVVQMYPGVDPFILILLIDRYRTTVIDLMFCRFENVRSSQESTSGSSVTPFVIIRNWFNV